MDQQLSPYNYQRPVLEISEFFGRENIISKIYSRIGATRPQSVSIVGDYKIGKTSLLSYLVQTEIQKQFLDNPGNYIFLFISIRDSQTKSLHDFVQALCKAISKQVGNDYFFTSIAESYTWFKRVVETLTKKGKKFILFMDDFNLITQNRDFPLEFFSFLRSLANNFNVAYVTSSYQDLQKLCASKDIEESPFFNIFSNITLRAFTPDVVRKIIDQKGVNGKIGLEGQIKLIQKYAGQFPYLVQLAGDVIYNLHEISKDSVLIEKFKEIFSEKSENYFCIVWDNLEEDYKVLLELIVSRGKISESQQYIVKELIRNNYIIQQGWEFTLFSPLFTEFIIRKGNIRTASSIAILFDKITRFFRPEKRNFRI